MANPNQGPIIRKKTGEVIRKPGRFDPILTDPLMDPQTSNILLNIPGNGTDAGQWDVPVNGNSNSIDGRFGGVVSVGVTNVNVQLDFPTPVSGTLPTMAVAGPTSSENAVLKLNGTPTASLTVTLPLPGYYIIDAVDLAIAPGTFVVLLAAQNVGTTGEVIGVPPGIINHVYCDGVNVRFVNLPPIGAYMDLAVTTTPLWMQACTRHYWLNCDGSAIPTSCPQLIGLIGGTLPDFRGALSATLNQGTDRIDQGRSGVNGDAIGSGPTVNGMDQTVLNIANLPEITSTGSGGANVTANNTAPGGVPLAFPVDPGATVQTGTFAASAAGNSVPISVGGSGWETLLVNQITSSGTATVTTTSQSTANTGFTNMPPTTMAGLRFIRAA